ncbi:MAG: tRNA (adenosine(37)-N6)-threonylcarbamoyltransferase complex ATPase subunit type 1 TsaE [Nitrospirae bacterium]|nr:tRNA (adenosine(37)-N6)-threonylcarbamoyltransferase complex ATPase subunit type 1 TsaE [Candidatus Troglogloeales bacterium]MBI3598848.1 tRNA (adenosine(37)-N6)-threonylcarbamoyltransferase complex ATPase subunit type 1 TsaE [Candidatus Troglogloeales bacterium]
MHNLKDRTTPCPSLTQEGGEGATLLLDDAQSTFLLGKQVGMSAAGGEVIGLIGPLGAGKTIFVQGLAEGLGITNGPIVSPTFVIMNLYQGRLPLCHIDLYRFDAPLETIGLDEYLNWNGVTAIEWADKTMIKEMGMIVEILDAGENKRRITIR